MSFVAAQDVQVGFRIWPATRFRFYRPRSGHDTVMEKVPVTLEMDLVGY
jgi:hypothetical protein